MCSPHTTPYGLTHSDNTKLAVSLAELRKGHEILQYEDSALAAKKKQLEADV